MKKLLNSILFGIMSVFDLYPQRDSFLEKKLYTSTRSDAEALRKDWERVGWDIHDAMDGMDRVIHGVR